MAKRKRTIEMTFRAPMALIQSITEIAALAGMGLGDVVNVMLAMELWRAQQRLPPTQGEKP